MSQVFANVPPTTSPYDGASRGAAALDVVELYKSLRRAPADSEDFELLMMEFNRVCQAAPASVLRALQQEAFVA